MYLYYNCKGNILYLLIREVILRVMKNKYFLT